MNSGNQLQAAVSDAKRFILAFRTVIEMAPLQIYSSALIFSPLRSVTRKRYERLIPRWIARQPCVEETWGASLHTLEGHSSTVNSVVFSQDGKLVASGSYDRTVRIWDVESGICAYRTTDITVSKQTLSHLAGQFLITKGLKNVFEPDLLLDRDRMQYLTYSIDKSFQWVKLGENNIFWLPANLRPSNHDAYNIDKHTIMLGNGSRRVTCLWFNPAVL